MHPLEPYFRIEFKSLGDAEAELNKQIALEEAEKKRIRKQFFRKITNTLSRIFDPNETNEYEEFLSKSISHEDLERRERIWQELQKRRSFF